jgi:hypothetical protein
MVWKGCFFVATQCDHPEQLKFKMVRSLRFIPASAPGLERIYFMSPLLLKSYVLRRPKVAAQQALVPGSIMEWFIASQKAAAQTLDFQHPSEVEFVGLAY